MIHLTWMLFLNKLTRVSYCYIIFKTKSLHYVQEVNILTWRIPWYSVHRIGHFCGEIKEQFKATLQGVHIASHRPFEI